jgi:NADH:ubiquinone oxidoreductase subunit F (NADH-binding)/(2Fe-2S) ferredoxin
MTAYSELRQRAEAVWRAYARPQRTRIDVSIATCSYSAGGHDTLARLRQEIAARSLPVDMGLTSCNGFCFAEPLVIVSKPDGSRVLYGPVRAPDVPALLDTAINGTCARLALGTIAGDVPDVPALAAHPFMKHQVRRLMVNCGVIDPENIDHAIARGGYEGLAKALELTDEQVVQQALDSGLWGRGGAAFPAGRKWDFLRGARNRPKYMVCNADEGDPGAFVNRIVMEADPHLLIEGMIIAAHAGGAEFGFIYIRDEYPLAVERMDTALQQARERGLLGENILGSGLKYDMVVVRGAGAYVCGEETGLLSSIQDSRGMPRIKPPFPANAGVFGLPSNVNNVETYACAPLIFRHGVEWFREQGTQKNTGTKMFSFTGDVSRVGCVEVPFGAKMGDLIRDNFGDSPTGRPVKAIQPGGPLAGILPASCIDLALEPEPFRDEGVLMGGGGIVVCDDTTCIVDLCIYFEWFAEDESCGRCTTCHGGTQRYVEILRRIAEGGGRSSDIELLELITDTLRWSNCFHGQGAPAAIQSLLRHFRDELMAHIRDKRCPAGVCAGLIRYQVTPGHERDVATGAAICPTNAIRQDDEGRSFVDQGLCIKCDACREVQPDAIQVLHLADLRRTAGAAVAAG